MNVLHTKTITLMSLDNHARKHRFIEQHTWLVIRARQITYYTACALEVDAVYVQNIGGNLLQSSTEKKV